MEIIILLITIIMYLLYTIKKLKNRLNKYEITIPKLIISLNELSNMIKQLKKMIPY